ncbi:MAG TPA: hypothetical protein VER58_11220 [Thermoanaerobaculia bacterium]|nr:hypothetical protein [Thermoanaerobaculia bacterium]
MTAAHVLRHLWDKLEMPWKQGKYPTNTVEPEFLVAAAQMVDIRGPDIAAHWEITGATPLDYTDIAFLNELKKGRPSDQVGGQVLRYMGWVKEHLCENDQIVKGLVICRDPDPKLSYALRMANNVAIRYYNVSFKLKDAP